MPAPDDGPPARQDAEAALAFGVPARHGSGMSAGAPNQTAPRATPAARLRRHWLVLALALACLLVEAALLGAEHGLWGSPRWRLVAYVNGGFWAGLLRAGWEGNFALQPATMFLSHAVLHAGLSHLAMNVVALLALGASVRRRAGQARLAAVLATSVLGGALAFGLFGPLAQPMVGASGALFGLAGAIIAWEARADWRAGQPPLRMLALALAVLALNLVSAWLVGWQMAWQAHAGGFLAGGAMALALRTRGEALTGGA